MRLQMLSGVCLVVVCVVVPGVVVPSVGAGSGMVTRWHFIKAIYLVRHTLVDPDVVMEWYYCPVTGEWRWHRGAFERYDSYSLYFGGAGKWIEIYLYWK